MNQQRTSGVQVEPTMLILSMIWITMTSGSGLQFEKDTRRVTEQWFVVTILFRIVNRSMNRETQSVTTASYY